MRHYVSCCVLASRIGRKGVRLAAKMLCISGCMLVILQGAASANRADVIAQQTASGREVWMHSDGSYESAYAWFPPGCQPPDYGSFAERYSGCGWIAAIVLDVTDDGIWENELLDAYVWDSSDGVPGNVLAVETDVRLYGVPYWPNVGRFFVDLSEPAYVDDMWWVGFWGNWPYSEIGFWVGADHDGPGGGSPMTKIAPGLEWPEGWQDVAVRWGSTAALGIGAEVDETPSPPISPTWGRIKGLFR